MDSANFAAMLSAGAGTIIVYVLLPFAIVVGFGLLVVGIIRRKVGAAFFGFVFPAGAWVLGSWMMSGGYSDPAVPVAFESSMGSARELAQYAWIGAGIVLLVVVAPGIFKATRARG